MYSVFICNKLIRDAVPADSKSCLVLSPMEFRVKYLLISLIQKDTSEFESIDITIPEFAKYLSLSWGGEQTKSLKIAIDNLIDFSYILDNSVIRWLSPDSHFADGIIHLKLDDSMKPYLLQIKNNFTLYN